MSDAAKPSGSLGNLLARPFRRKSVADIHEDHETSSLHRTLSASNLVFFGIGTIIGTGIFVLTGQAAAQFAGPGIMISFVATGILCALVALCYAELAAAIPVSGSAYSYSYASIGELGAWFMGLLLISEYGLAVSTVAVGWSGYVVSLLHDFGIDVPAQFAAAPGGTAMDPATGAMVPGIVNVPAIAVILALTGLLVAGVRESAFVNNVIVFTKVAVIVAFIAIGAGYVNTALWFPLIPDQVPAPPAGTDMSLSAQIWTAFANVLTGENTSHYGVGGLITGAATAFFAYLGFEAVSTAGTEARNPARDMPIGILGSLAICTVLYILTTAVLLGIVPYAQLDDPAPIAKAVNQMGLPWFAKLVKVGAIAGLSSTMLIGLYGQTRIFYTMARDGLLPGVFAKVHQRFKTPWLNTIIVGVVAAALAGFMGIDQLINLANVGTLLAFAIVCFTVIYLRIAMPEMKRPFKAPLFPITPILGGLSCLFLLASLMANPVTRNFVIEYLSLGVVVYFAFGLWNSRLNRAG